MAVHDLSQVMCDLIIVLNWSDLECHNVSKLVELLQVTYDLYVHALSTGRPLMLVGQVLGMGGGREKGGREGEGREGERRKEKEGEGREGERREGGREKGERERERRRRKEKGEGERRERVKEKW